jgi:hypothetical protein
MFWRLFSLVKIGQDREVKFDMTTRKKKVFGVCKRHIFMIFFFLLFLLMGNANICHQLSIVLSLNIVSRFLYFMLMMFASVCRKACLYNFREHAVHCRELACFKYRHEFVRDVHFDIFRRAGISVKK